jgi:hypothetical protein
MKLTKVHRQAFVTAVMQDVPQFDYEKVLHAFLKERSVEYLPAQLRAAALDKELSQYLATESAWCNHHSTGISACTVFSKSRGCFRLTPEDKKIADKIMRDAERQIDERAALKERIQGVIASCTTVKMAKERLPEFVKYLPEEIEQTKNLPAIANIVADLTKLGWPKSAQKAMA